MKIRKIVLLGLIILKSSLSFSQINKDDISIELRYPIPVGNNFINKGFGDGYIGLIDIGIDYNFIKTKNLGIGILLNTSLLRLSETDLTLMILSPKMKLDYFINIGKFTLVPQIAVGYSSWRFRAPAMTFTDEFGNIINGRKFENNENGLSFKGAAKLIYNSSRKIELYFQFAYEYTRLEKPKEPAVGSKFNQNMQIIYPVIGMIWKFK